MTIASVKVHLEGPLSSVPPYNRGLCGRVAERIVSRHVWDTSRIQSEKCERCRKLLLAEPANEHLARQMKSLLTDSQRQKIRICLEQNHVAMLKERDEYRSRGGTDEAWWRDQFDEVRCLINVFK